MDDNRDFLKKGDEIWLCKENSDTKEKFTILSVEGAGASSICYSAKCGKRTGRLKEFYPSEYNYGSYISIERSNEMQINASENVTNAVEVFNRMMNEYIEAYHTLQQVKNDNNENKVFNTFIPAFEIYRGIDKQRHPVGSAYIWTADNDGQFKTFEQLIDDIHKNPEINPGKNLFTILTAVRMLAECIKTIHCAGLLHCDIKPSNFGSPIRNGRYLTEQLSLFDVNSIYSVYSEFPKLTGTINFCAPEVMDGEATNQSDIYSIGATLFNAVVVGEKEEESYYSDDMYYSIKQIIASSKLIQASELNSDIEMQERLAHVLEKCLCPSPYGRYESCDDLMEDLKKTIVYLLPYEYGDSVDLGNKLVLIKAENALKKSSEKNPTFAIQSFLFDNPLYKFVNDDSDKIKILILGFGAYSKKFLDIALQIGQMKGLKPEVMVLTKKCKESRESYLKARPALKDFFDIDGEKCGEDSYGSIVFKEAPGRGMSDDTSYNIKYLKRFVYSKFIPNYVFISLSDDKHNYAVAEACSEVCRINSSKAFVGYIASQKGRQRKISDTTKPICIFEKAQKIKHYREIERMAFNSHILWKDSFNIDYRKLHKEFSGKYYHDASVASVLSIKYKLHSIKIELDSFEPEVLSAVAEEYRKKYLDESESEDFSELVAAEHRRWVVEKITAGWVCRKNYDDCLEGKIHDAKKKEHPCIVRCEPNRNLQKYFKENEKWINEMWDRECEEDKYLDELDSVSVNLHRAFYKRAIEIKNENILNGVDVKEIRRLISRDSRATRLFDDWHTCLEKIWMGEEQQTRLYEGLKDAFLNSVKGYQKVRMREICYHVQLIDSKVFSVINSLKMRDYKSSDIKLIESIPFILTFYHNVHLAIPFKSGSNLEIFNNISAATLINPAKISYFFYVSKSDDLYSFETAIRNIEEYMDQKKIKAKLVLYFVHKEDHSILDRLNAFENRIRENDKKLRIRNITFISIENEKNGARRLKKYIKSTDLFEKNDSLISNLLEKDGFFKNHFYYVFNSAEKTFAETSGCEWLNYISNKQFLTVSDILSLRNSKGSADSIPSFNLDYRRLWQIYKNDIYAWKSMCKILKEYSDARDTIAEFRKENSFEKDEMHQFVVSSETSSVLGKTINKLKDIFGIIGRQSSIQYRTTDTKYVNILANEQNCLAFEKIISNPYFLLSQQDLYLSEQEETVKVTFDSLIVDKVDISTVENSDDVVSLLKTLRSENYISNLSIDGKIVSFTYITRQTKRLMTYAGKILEIYIYHSALDSGLFSDVVSVYIMDSKEAEVKDKLDCIVTSGFKSLIIECKTHPQIKENFYNDFSDFAGRFGINATAVIVFDTPEIEKISKDNKCDNLVTVSDPQDIENIAQTLSRIIG